MMAHRLPIWFFPIVALLFVVAAAVVSLPDQATTLSEGWQNPAIDQCHADTCIMSQTCAASCAWALVDDRPPVFRDILVGFGLSMNAPIFRGRVAPPEPYPPPASLT